MVEGGTAEKNGSSRCSNVPYFLRYTFRPIFSFRLGMVTLPYVEAMMMVLPEADGPNSLERSTVIVSIVPSTRSSTFFTLPPFSSAIVSER